MLEVYKLRCEGMTNPIGISIKNPRLTWSVKSDKRAVTQEWFKVTVMEEKPNGKRELIYDTGDMKSSNTFVNLPEIFTKSGTRYVWTVEITDNYAEKCCAKDEAWFETGLLYETDWKAKWVEPKQHPVYKDSHTPGPDEPKQSKLLEEEKLFSCPMLRKEFSVKNPIRRARIYATAHGIYRLILNEKRVGDYELAPESTAYNKYLQVQTYDVTALLQQGENVLGMVLADGWWAGRMGYYGVSVQYGDMLAALMQIHILYTDGTEEIIGTDKSFQSSDGPRRFADIQIGEKYDMNMEKPGWMQAGYDDSTWKSVDEKNYSLDNLAGQNAPHIRVLEKLNNAEIYISSKGEKIIDCKQVMAGNASMKLKGQPGAAITLRYFEEPDKDGNYWFELDGRNCLMTDYFVLDETGEGIYDPWFTYHAFRYIYISSDKGEVYAEEITARLIASDLAVTADIRTSNEKLNRLQKNIEWTLRSNMTSVMTDNPDRERAGWTGDLEMISPTLCYNLDIEAFIRRWLGEARLEQRRDGGMPLVIPNWDTYDNMIFRFSAGWGDAAVIVPWVLYERYGDKRILEENYDMMKKWVSFVKKRVASGNPDTCIVTSPEQEKRLEYIWNNDINFGDWMTPSAGYNEETGEYTYNTFTLCHLTGTYYFAYSTALMAKVARVLGYESDIKYYEELNERIRNAAIEEIYKNAGILESEYMGAQILALHMGFYPENEKDKLIDRILQLISQKGMDTGFTSSLLIHDLLCENGYVEKAYDFLLNEEYPSLLYEVTQGATSVWEAMQAVMPDGTRNAVSFIQPPFCSVGNWMVQSMGGIRPLEPGFKKIKIRPYFTDRLQCVDVSYVSEYGKIRSCWRKSDGKVEMEVEIPDNTTALIFLPGAREKGVYEMGKDVHMAEGVIGVEERVDGVYAEIGSGRYLFEYNENVGAAEGVPGVSGQLI